MAQPSDETSVESLIGALRADVVEPCGEARERISARLALGVMAELFASAWLASFLQSGLLRSKAFAVVLTLPVGIAIGALGHAWVASRHAVPQHAAPTALVVNRLEPAVATAPPVATVVAPAVVTPEPTAASLRAPRRQVGPAKSNGHAGSRELSQLERARTLLSDGHAAATLALLRAHVARYPRSALEQERQALYIKALVAADQMVAARKRAAAFVRLFPKSTLRGSVENAVAPIP
jgi:hypothetical protein